MHTADPVPILRGRGFTRAETESEGGPRVAIIDEELGRRLWPDQDPVGRRIGFGSDPDSRHAQEITVVGVVPTVRDDLWPAEPNPHVYVPFGQDFQAGMHIHLRAAPGRSASARRWGRRAAAPSGSCCARAPS